MHVVHIILFCVVFGRFLRPEDELDAIVWGQTNDEIDLDEVTIGEEDAEDFGKDFQENLLSEVGKNGLSVTWIDLWGKNRAQIFEGVEKKTLRMKETVAFVLQNLARRLLQIWKNKLKIGTKQIQT